MWKVEALVCLGKRLGARPGAVPALGKATKATPQLALCLKASKTQLFRDSSSSGHGIMVYWCLWPRAQWEHVKKGRLWPLPENFFTDILIFSEIAVADPLFAGPLKIRTKGECLAFSCDT